MWSVLTWWTGDKMDSGLISPNGANRHAGDCCVCGERVEAGQGRLIQSHANWAVAHARNTSCDVQRRTTCIARRMRFLDRAIAAGIPTVCDDLSRKLLLSYPPELARQIAIYGQVDEALESRIESVLVQNIGD